MADNRLEIVLINTDEIAPNDYNPNVVPDDIRQKLKSEIAEKGMCEPILIRQKGDKYEIIDGEHRWRVCQELGWKLMPCIIKDYDDKEAKIKTLQLNYLRGSAIPLKLAYLIHNLNKEIKLEELVERLPYAEIELKDYLELLKLPEDLNRKIEAQALKEEDELPLSLTFILYRVQASIVEKAIATAVKKLEQNAKNLRALALTKICAQYLEQEGVIEEPEAAIKNVEAT